MYKFIYYFVYCFMKDKEIRSTNSASMFVCVAMIFHFFLFLQMFKLVFNYELLPTNNLPMAVRSFTLIVFFLLFFYVVDYYFRKRLIHIKEFYQGKQILSFRNGIAVSALIVVSMLLFAEFLNNYIYWRMLLLSFYYGY